MYNASKDQLNNLIYSLEQIQEKFLRNYGVDDIFSNSKFYEIIMANELEHDAIPGHSGSRDARDNEGEYEYKHFKESSSNHSWTFNDYSETTIQSLEEVKAVIFAHIDDRYFPPKFDWYIKVDGPTCSKYLRNRTEDLLKRKPKGRENARKMINFSALQLENDLNLKKTIVQTTNKNGKYSADLQEITNISTTLEKLTNISQILTSNKIWEFLVSLDLNHIVLSEQSGHDAKDISGNYYEYKVSKNRSWNFQDISDNVLNKYTKEKTIILAVVDKQKMQVKEIYGANPNLVVKRLKEKLQEKTQRFKQHNRQLRRLQVSLSIGDLQRINATKLSK